MKDALSPPVAALAAPEQPADVQLLSQLTAAETRGHQAGRLAELATLVAESLALCEGQLARLLEAPGVIAAPQAATHLVGAGGKRIRPLLLALCARACQAEPERAPSLSADALVALMTAAELTHSATLLHDDVIDDSALRRGRPASRLRWGNAVSVLAGDFVLTRALEEVVRSGIAAALPALLETIHAMIAGEALQLALRGRSDVTQADYLSVIDGKTGALFAFCGRAAALAAGTPAYAEPLGRFTRHLGRAFQIVDDVLDATSDPATLGKDVLSDLREGKLTLPVLLALEARPALRGELLALSESEAVPPTAAAVMTLQAALVESRAAARAREHAKAEATAGLAALGELPETPFRAALAAAAEEVVSRDR